MFEIRLRKMYLTYLNYLILFLFSLVMQVNTPVAFAGTDDPNNTSETAIELVAGEQLLSSIDYSGDQDWFKITVDHTCSLTGTFTTNNGRVYFRLYDSNLNQVFYTEAGSSTFSYKVNPGTYYVKLHEWSGVNYSNNMLTLKQTRPLEILAKSSTLL